MATIIKNYKQLETAMGRILKDGVFDVAKTIEGIVDEFLARWYGDYTPQRYRRTEQFLYSCITSKVVKHGNQYKTQVYIDYKNMHHVMKLPDHTSRTRPLTKSEELQIVENANRGIHGIMPGEKGYSEFRFWDEANREMDNKDIIVQTFYSFLQWKGFEVDVIYDNGGMPF